ncbi:Ni/Fe hydrogenase subunit alpha [Mycolicibacterium smegmatis]|uniref:Nickel-dependent hydrogenase, large subunit n=3 Tax=Mycolicibacterium smegmatis TaxID=1772 RepID=I7GAV5_MYCS2|nr:Ni/Fe hydrogenase subunit alpha [Mycolicibacterium smegmatis]ABK76036.1 [NiFe] hydrogenase, alpha subunit, putative [Mycolicibacterium smegmatis MC2 155]AFP40296.1 Nickel-dependent hydrogenase, large subunit [Mycolicibacterium smegmatis MC2 155]AIU09044.1 dehydrogenase [Mycolicibacterium smegmatis MC2 155]AIU15669.1 dehydrogenase [Mycolicibacterium smegmatis]AIU22292.1 dehydrogenase [Mycolicibacterium smegmatis]
MNPEVRTLSVGALARVEGEGALHVTLRDGAVVGTQLNIYEPPRFFEAFLRGRAHTEPPDLTARVCGICPVAYQVSACNAIEDACGVTVDPEIVQLRRLLYCGEWIHSHALHIFLLHLPDFLGHPDGISLAREHPELVERGLSLKKTGNRIMEQIGGRAIHPVNVRLGGFYSAPKPGDLKSLAALLRKSLDDALYTVREVADLDCPDVVFDHEFLALGTADAYPIESGAIVRSAGPSFPLADFTTHVGEAQVPHSTALHAALDDGRYLTGPLARYSLNSAHLPPIAREAATSAGLGAQCRNPFRSIVVRAVEVVFAIEEALRIIAEYQEPPRPFVEVPARAGVGHGVSEAPRGLLYHRYEIGHDGLVRTATLIPPTAQNQAAIEHELAVLVAANLDRDDAELTQLCERAIRNHDPCISCATHFLTLTLDRG